MAAKVKMFGNYMPPWSAVKRMHAECSNIKQGNWKERKHKLGLWNIWNSQGSVMQFFYLKHCSHPQPNCVT